MFPRYGFPVFVVFLIICMQKTVVNGAGGLDEECQGTSCTDQNHVCDTNMFPNKCRIKEGAACTSTDKCVDGATCSSTCACDSGRPATANHTCSDLVGLNGDCSGQKTCITGLVCENNLCLIKAGVSCANHTDKCVEGATCDTTSHNCQCDAGRMPATAEGKCQQPVAVGGDCTGGKACGTNLVCENNICKYTNGTDCSGNADKCVARANCTATGTGNAKVCVCGTPAATNGTCTAPSPPGATKVSVGGACSSGNQCDTGLVCQSGNCKIASGTNCTGHENDCVEGATCSTNKQCTCHSWRSPATQNGPCGGVPAAGTTGGPCAANPPACTESGFVCEDNICKIKHGADCTLHADLCVKNAACPATGAKNCSCDSTKFSATEQGLCAAKNGAPSLLASLLFVVGLLGTSRLI